MLLDGKLCAMLGLMNGTEVIIETILLNEKDHARVAEKTVEQGNVISLTHMPDGILVRAPREKWILPEELLPGLPPDTPLHKRRGLFLVRPSPSKVF